MSSTPPPPPPPPGRPASPPGWGAPTPSAGPGLPLPPGGWHPSTPARPPRPAVPVAAYLLLGGAALTIVGSLLEWFSLPQDGVRITGFTEVAGESRDGPAFVFFAIVLIGFGITLLAARRVLPVAILAVIVAVVVIVVGIVDLSDIADAKEVVDALGGQVDIGPGLPVVIAGGLVALAGGIVALATRRR